ncbi:MAG: nucleoside triphosphate pyrophosphohydrolase family protein [Parcubacteria group bacterium]
MELNEYQKRAVETAVYPDKYKIIYPAVGLGDEAGEVLGKVSKWLRGDDGDGEMTQERKEAIKLELGDVLWFVSNLAKDIGFSLEDVAVSNIDKLQSRKERGVIRGDGDNR